MVSHDLYNTLTQRVSNFMIVLSLTEITTYSALLQRCSYVDYRTFDTTINIAIFSHNKDTILVFFDNTACANEGSFFMLNTEKVARSRYTLRIVNGSYEMGYCLRL